MNELEKSATMLFYRLPLRTQPSQWLDSKNELYPDAVRSADGTKLIIGMELTNIMEAISEFQGNFQHGAELVVLSHSEVVELMRTPEWEPYIEPEPEIEE